MKITAPDGTCVSPPDGYPDGRARQAARALRQAGAGDLAALAALRGLGREAAEPLFARTLLESLGPDAPVTLPIALAGRLGGCLDAAGAVRIALSVLSRTLAAATDPASAAFLGDGYARRLAAAGPDRCTDGVRGFQGLATVLAAPSPVAYSSRFLRIVGRPMVSFARRQPVPLPTLVGVYGLGDALDGPSRRATPGHRDTDMLVPLLALAAVGPATARALLSTADVAALLGSAQRERRAVLARLAELTAFPY